MPKSLIFTLSSTFDSISLFFLSLFLYHYSPVSVLICLFSNLDFTCFHFLPRHHNIIRFRMGRPFRFNDKDRGRNQVNYMNRIFRESCHWNSFTLNYVDWVYEYFILDPPVPVNCPIQGRYMFKQTGQKEEMYYTKMPDGMTPRPRLQVLHLLNR